MVLINIIIRDLNNLLETQENFSLEDNPDRHAQKAIINMIQETRDLILYRFPGRHSSRMSKEKVKDSLCYIRNAMIGEANQAVTRSFLSGGKANTAKILLSQYIASGVQKIISKLEDGEYDEISA